MKKEIKVKKDEVIDIKTAVGVWREMGLNFDQRVNLLEKVLEKMIPRIEKEISEKEPIYNNNLEIRKKFSDDYKIQDFIPFYWGMRFHKERNKKKQKEDWFFYKKSNEEFLPRMLDKVYNAYHFLSFYVPSVIGIMEYFNK